MMATRRAWRRLAGGLLLGLGASGILAAEAKVDLVRVLKGERKLQLLAGTQVLREFPVALGGNPLGHKQQEGDRRTPEGRYLLDYKKADSAFYKAIHISYPNGADLAAARKRGVAPGGQIMIHGQKNGLGALWPPGPSASTGPTAAWPSATRTWSRSGNRSRPAPRWNCCRSCGGEARSGAPVRVADDQVGSVAEVAVLVSQMRMLP